MTLPRPLGRGNEIFDKLGFSQKIIRNMPYTKVLIHYIWSTKNREHLITKELKPLLLEHIKANSIKKDIFIDTLNCIPDHIHLLVSLGTEQTIAKTAMLIKGESSYWVNIEQLLKSKFEWQDEYIALSVSYSAIDKVRAYILNQEVHHKKKTFTEEYEEFLIANNFETNLAKANKNTNQPSTT
jgi:putative transposase